MHKSATQRIEKAASEFSHLILKNIGDCTEDQQSAVRDIRNQDSVRSCMYTDHIISIEEHQSWISKLRNDSAQQVFVILAAELKPIGVLSVNAIDNLHKKADWAFYLEKNARGGLGAALEYFLLNYVFYFLRLEKLNCEVIETNASVVRLHEKFGFLKEGYRRSNLEKNGKRIGVYLLGITKQEWDAIHNEIKMKHQNIINKYHIALQSS